MSTGSGGAVTTRRSLLRRSARGCTGAGAGVLGCPGILRGLFESGRLESNAESKPGRVALYRIQISKTVGNYATRTKVGGEVSEFTDVNSGGKEHALVEMD